MAEAAFWSQAPLVLIIGLVTAHAVQRGILVSCRQVTLFACTGSVQADKGELGKIMVKKDLFSPPLVVVAPLTPLPFLALVDIIQLVTAVAGRRQLLLVEMPNMAGIAIDLAVFASEGKIGFVVVVNGTFPVLWCMAGLTLLSVATPVFVVVLVTAVAGRRQLLLVEMPFMADIAIDLAVFASEGKIGFVVVVNGTFPVLWCMAGLALLSIAAAVNIIQLVT